jgi:hypothetical protein
MRLMGYNQANIFIMGVAGEEMGKGTQSLFNEKKAENFPYLGEIRSSTFR